MPRYLLCQEEVSRNGHRLWKKVPHLHIPIQYVKVRPRHPVSPLQILTENLILFRLEQTQESDREDWLAAALGEKSRSDAHHLFD